MINMEIAWSLVLFTALTGCGGWLLASVAIDEFAQKTPKADFPSAVCALALLVVGGLASVTHLAHPENMMAALNHPTSGIFIEAVLVGVAALFAIIYLLVFGRNELARRICAVGGAVFGVALSFMAGHSYLMAAIATWNTMLLPLAYLGTAMASGVALYCLIGCLRSEGENASAFFALLAVSGVAAALTGVLYFSHAGSLVDVTPLCAIGTIGLGGLVPAVGGVLAVKRPAWRSGVALASLLCAAVGALCLRAAMWLAYVPLENFFGLTL